MSFIMISCHLNINFVNKYDFQSLSMHSMTTAQREMCFIIYFEQIISNSSIHVLNSVLIV